jgi:hypothetical protein
LLPPPGGEWGGGWGSKILDMPSPLTRHAFALRATAGDLSP